MWGVLLWRFLFSTLLACSSKFHAKGWNQADSSTHTWSIFHTRWGAEDQCLLPTVEIPREPAVQQVWEMRCWWSRKPNWEHPEGVSAFMAFRHLLGVSGYQQEGAFPPVLQNTGCWIMTVSPQDSWHLGICILYIHIICIQPATPICDLPRKEVGKEVLKKGVHSMSAVPGLYSVAASSYLNRKLLKK